MQRRGVRAAVIDRRVYAPFPVAGEAAWGDTWGAPRHVGGYHPHHGQDLLCAEGTPLLAVGPGTVEMRRDPLGGTTILLVRPDGSFWYYAHLASYANGIVEGQHVTTGERIGRCGSTGDATVSHLHFSLYTAFGQAIDPMPDLVAWLHDAELTAGLSRSNGTGVHLPKSFRRGGDAGAEPTDVAEAAHPTQLSAGGTPREPFIASAEVDPPTRRAVMPFVVGAALVLLPLPLLSRRVRAGLGRLRSASRSP
jgi:murein DD-endopeptidase MepM/ murein hydrolase activator NlpD